MDEAPAMGGVQGIGDLAAVAQHLIERQRSPLQPLRQRLSLEVFHDEEVDAVVTADVVERADVRVRERRDGLRFALETLAERRVGGQPGRQDLDGHIAAEPCVPAAIHFAHAARAGGRHDFIGTQARPGLERHGRGL